MCGKARQITSLKCGLETHRTRSDSVSGCTLCAFVCVHIMRCECTFCALKKTQKSRMKCTLKRLIRAIKASKGHEHSSLCIFSHFTFDLLHCYCYTTLMLLWLKLTSHLIELAHTHAIPTHNILMHEIKMCTAICEPLHWNFVRWLASSHLNDCMIRCCCWCVFVLIALTAVCFYCCYCYRF